MSSSPMELRPGPYVELPSRRRRWIHPVLFAATLATVTVAGYGWAGDEGWAGAFRYSIPLLTILLAHEMGHYLACRYYGIPATLPYFIPGIPILIGTFGAVIRIRGPIPNRRALFDVAAAGPIAGLVVAIPFLVLGILRAVPAIRPPGPDQTILGDSLAVVLLSRLMHAAPDLVVGPYYGAAWFGLLVTSMNLFPLGQLDGGHAVYAISRRLHRVLSWVTLAGLLGWVGYATVTTRQISTYTLWLAILLFLRDRHPRLVDEGGRLGPVRIFLAVVLLAIFVLTFMPNPISFAD